MARRKLAADVAALAIILGLMASLSLAGMPFSASAAVSLKGMSQSFGQANPTAIISEARGSPAFGELQPIEPLVTGLPQSICQSAASVMFLGVNLGQDKALAQQFYPLVTIDLYLDGNLQASTRGKLEKFVDATDPVNSWWYQFISYVIYPGGSLSVGTHTASSVVSFNAVPIFSGSDTLTVLAC
jgi:hypothetical protein